MNAMDNMSLPFTWAVDDHSEMQQILTLNSPPLIFVNKQQDEEEARAFLEAIGQEVVVLNRHLCCHTITAFKTHTRKHGVAFICGRGWLTGWQSSVPGCVVMWGRNWDRAEVAQASLRMRGRLPVSRTFVYASRNDQAEQP